METIGMQGVAELARVRRPVVSMWRKRFEDSDTPFPAPLTEVPLSFDAQDVAAWLTETKHGNNPDALLETQLHSSTTKKIINSPGAASALLLASHLTGERPLNLDPAIVEQSALAHGVEMLLTDDQLAEALADRSLVYAVDELVEAAYSPVEALRHVFNTSLTWNRTFLDDVFTADAREFLGQMIAVTLDQPLPALCPQTRGALITAGDLVSRLEEHERPEILVDPELATTPEDLLVWRYLVAQGHAIAGADQAPMYPSVTRIHVSMQGTSKMFFSEMETLVEELGPNDRLIVVGPARLMVDEEGASARRALLAPHPSYTERLRYTAELPRGLSRYRTRMRLALWGFGAPSSELTVIGTHAANSADEATANLIGADLAAGLTGDQAIHQHAFFNSTMRASSLLLRRESLTVTADKTPPREGGEHLARIWELDSEALKDIILEAAEPQIHSVSFSDATPTYARRLAGSKIPSQHVGPPAPGRVGIIGKTELEATHLMGSRSIDRLTLESVAPRARLTEPGDVVYAKNVGALVDNEGGNVVQTPARILRCKPKQGQRTRVLSPHVVARDLNLQATEDPKTWQLRTVTQETADMASLLGSRLDAETARLQAALEAVSHLEHSLLDGLGDGSLSATPKSEDEPHGKGK